MTTIERIENKLRQTSSITFSTVDDTLVVEPETETGFSVWLTEKSPGYTVGFDGWHEEFEDEEEALATFAFGLSEDCRLKVVQRGSQDYSWTVESLENGQWTGDSTTALLLVPFWKKRRVVYRQNHHFPGSDEES